MNKIALRKWIVLLISIIVSGCFSGKSSEDKQQALPTGTPIEVNLSFDKNNGTAIAYQNGIPVPSFDPQKREIIDLKGKWKKERVNVNHDISLSARDTEGIKMLEIEGVGRHGISYDDSSWEIKSLPSPENRLSGYATSGAAEVYQDGIWYRKEINIDSSCENKAITLKMLGINYIGDIWINGNWAGYHEGGFTPFAINATPYLKKGKNNIAIRVDNIPWGYDAGMIPMKDSTDFFNYAGIINDIYLEITSEVLISRVDIIPTDIYGNAKVKVIVENRSAQEKKISLIGEIFEGDKGKYFLSKYSEDIIGSITSYSGNINESLLIEKESVYVAEYDIIIDSPKLWSIKDPNLYIAKMSISEKKDELDTFFTQFGIRTVDTQGAYILLNEKPVFLAGIARHEEWLEYGRYAEWDRILVDLQQMKDLGINYVRTGHWPNHVQTYIILDRLGLLSASEIPVWQADKKHFIEQREKGLAEQMWREMILSQYNRPSVIMWSTQNESRAENERLEYNERLVNDLRENYNDGRLTTQSAAADRPGYYDPSMEPLDVVGFTTYFGVFYDNQRGEELNNAYLRTKDFIKKAKEYWPDKPVITTEFGIWSQGGNSSEEFQTELYSSTMEAYFEKMTVYPQGYINDSGCLAGINFWTMYDWYVHHNKWIDTMGIYKMDRTEMKTVGNLITNDYTYIMKNNGVADEITTPPETKYISNEPRSIAVTENSVELVDNNSMIYELKEAIDFTEYNFLCIKAADELVGHCLVINVKDENGESASYKSRVLMPESDGVIKVPFIRINCIDLTKVKEVRIVGLKKMVIKIEEIYLTF